MRIFIANFKLTQIMQFKNMHHGVAGEFKGMHHGVAGEFKGMHHGVAGQFRAQSGSQDYYQAGVAMAQAVFNEGGVNALLAFLAGYNAAG